MKKLLIIMLLPLAARGQTLRQCQDAAGQNYPLIRQYDLIRQTTQITVSNISRAWWPQISASAQASLQSDVTDWPQQMKALYEQMGIAMQGLRRDQYRIGIDVSQTLYDGGAVRLRQEIARRQGEVDEADTEVTLYQVRRRVNEMYFALLLLDEQIRLNADLRQLLSGNEGKLASMHRQGTAAESDYLSVKAERLKIEQQGADLQAQRRMLCTLLSTFCGIQVTAPQKPSVAGGGPPGQRPELKAVGARLRLADAQERSLRASLRPRLSLFAQGYYGYPGLNLFRDMTRHEWTLNGIVGARLAWNIGALYTIKNDKAKIQMQRDMAQNSRDVFLFNNNLQQVQQDENIVRYQRLMEGDEEIIALRSAVRKAAESKLAHGIIDVNDLLKEINAESSAQVEHTIHEIQMLKEICDLKFTQNNDISQ